MHKVHARCTCAFCICSSDILFVLFVKCAIASKPTANEILPPYKIRLKMSLPSISVPKICCQVGAWQVIDKSCCWYWYGAIIGAQKHARAQQTKNAKHTNVNLSERILSHITASVLAWLMFLRVLICASPLLLAD